MDDTFGRPEPSDELYVPFLFVPHGDPEPSDWMAAHPGWIRLPAVMMPRSTGPESEPAAQGDSSIEQERPGMIAAFSRRSIPPNTIHSDPLDPTSAAFDPVLTLQLLGYDFDNQTDAQRAQWYLPFLEGPLSKEPEGLLPRLMQRIPRQSGKEAADDVPSWARGFPRRVGETPEDYGTRLVDEQYGRGNWSSSRQQREFNQIKKHGSRAYRDPRIDPPLISPEGDGDQA